MSEDEQMYRTIFENMTDGLIISDLKTGRVLEANPSACTMHGYSHTQFIGLSPTTFIHTKSQKVFNKALQAVHGSNLFEAVVLQVRQDGSTFTAEWRGTTILFQERRCLLSVIQDVTQRTNIEKRLNKNYKARINELSMLLEFSCNLAYNQKVQPWLILDQLRGFIGFENAGLFELTGSTLTALSVRVNPSSRTGRLSPGSSTGRVSPGSSTGQTDVGLHTAQIGPGYRMGQFIPGPDTGWDDPVNMGEVPPELEQTALLRVPLEDPKILETLYKNHHPIRVGDIQSGNPSGRFFRELLHGDAIVLQEGMQSGMWVPLAVNDRVIGGMILVHSRRNYFTTTHARLALSIADQVAASLVNAESNEQALGLAVRQERQRLAQNLHDAVNQSLFSAGLIAEVLPRLWEMDPPDARQSLEDLRQLIRGAQAEMRAILADLRPAVLTDSSLSDLLRQLVDAFTGRTNVPVSLNIAGEDILPSNIQVLLYRICQEALNNIAKHAKASRVKIDLYYEKETENAAPGLDNVVVDQETAVNSVELLIRDDGRGFNPRKQGAPGHYGLSMMHERAESAGAQLTFTSRKGYGTLVTLRWQKKPKQENS